MTPSLQQAGHELLPCPFCGAQPMEYCIEPHSHAMVIDGFKMPDHPGSDVVECGCGAGLIADTRAKVVAMWNRRSNVTNDGAGVNHG